MSRANLHVSVIIPVYNGERFLLEAIRDVQEQGHAPLEIIVIDDGSSDGTAALLAELGDQVRTVGQTNRGSAAARNRGIDLARGNVIAFHDVDDLWAPGGLASLLSQLEARPEVDIAQGLIRRLVLEPGKDSFRASGEPYQFVNLGSAIFRRSVFDRVGRFDEALRDNEDTDWFLRAWELGIPKVVVPRLMLLYRLHDRNLVHSQNAVAGGMLRMVKRHLDRTREEEGEKGRRGEGEKVSPTGALRSPSPLIPFSPSHVEAAAYIGVPPPLPSRPTDAVPPSVPALAPADATYNFAVGWERRGKLEKALAGYRETLRLQADHLHARLALGRLLLAEQRMAEAVEIFRQGVLVRPNDPDLHKGLASALVLLDGLAAAFAHYGLERRDTRPVDIGRREVLACVVVRNEAARLPFFLAYYRRLGVDRFLFVDNDSADGTLELLLAQPDVHVWSSSFSFNRANFGSAWFEVLLRAYGVGHWCVMVDADELLVFPGCESKPLSVLCRALDRRGKRALTAVLLDMYSDKRVRDTLYTPGENFRDVCPYFDRTAYHERHENTGPYRCHVGYFGGVRRRAFGEPNYLLSKVPLLRYDTDVVLQGGQHFTNLPPALIASEVAAVLHFKFFSSFPDSVAAEVRRGEHYDNALQYRQYAQALAGDHDLTLHDPSHSVRYTGSQQLVDLGIMQVGESAEESANAIPSDLPRVSPVSANGPRPTWSVLITVYDRTQWLEQALRSVLDQAPGIDDMQIQVVQDGSDPAVTAAVRAIIDGVAPGRVEYHRAGARLGQPEIHNLCVALARGHFIHLLHDDDWVAPGYYYALLAGFHDGTKPGAAFCRHEYTDGEGKPLRLSWLERETPGVIPDWLERIAVSCRLQMVGMAVCREVYERLGGFNPAVRSAFDWEMWVRIAAQYPVWFEPKPLAHFRTHPGAETAGLVRSSAQIADARRAMDLVHGYLPVPLRDSLTGRARTHLALYAVETARRLRDAGDWRAAWANLSQALECSRALEVVNAVTGLFGSDEDIP